MFRSLFVRLACIAALVTMASNAALAEDHEGCDINAENMPIDAMVTGQVKSIGFLVGARWGSGELRMSNGESRRFQILGLKALETGAATNNFTGEVYNLRSIDDFEGTYYGAATKISLVRSKGEAVVNNGKCVIVKVRMDGRGLQVSGPAPGGVEVSFTD